MLTQANQALDDLRAGKLLRVPRCWCRSCPSPFQPSWPVRHAPGHALLRPSGRPQRLLRTHHVDQHVDAQMMHCPHETVELVEVQVRLHALTLRRPRSRCPRRRADRTRRSAPVPALCRTGRPHAAAKRASRLVGGVAHVVVDEPAHGLRGQRHAIGDGLRGDRRHHVGRGIDPAVGTSAAARRRGRAMPSPFRSQVAAGGIAADRNARAGSMPSASACAVPVRGDAIVHRGQEFMFWRHAVVHPTPRSIAPHWQAPAHAIVRIEVAEQPAAAMVVDQRNGCRQAWCHWR